MVDSYNKDGGDSHGTKVCIKCGNEFAATVEFFYGNKKAADGIENACRRCRSSQARAYSEANRDKKKAYYEANKDRILKKKKQYNEENKNSIRKQRKARYKANNEIVRAKSIAYHKANKNMCNDRSRAYYSANKAMVKEKKKAYNKANKDKNKERSKVYYEANKDRIGSYNEVNKDRIGAQAKVRNNGPALCKTYFDRISIAEDVRDNNGYIDVPCAYCGKRFLPTVLAVTGRYRALNGNHSGEHRLYCQDSCKMACQIYKKVKYPGTYRKATSRESNPVLRQLVFKRDNYECQKCGSTESLHCHHVVPARQNPFTANDLTACITYCKSCHKEVHNQDGCKYHQLKCIDVKEAS